MAQRRMPQQPAQSKQRINEQIRISPIRVIAEDGEQLGIIPTIEAMNRARDAGLDLVEVASEAKPPVCRIMDYGKFKYQQNKRQSKSKSHQVKLKEIRVRPKTGENDILVKANRARGFLEHKSKVMLTVQFRGRERAHIDEGRRVIEHMIELLADIGKPEKAPQHQGWRINCIIVPNK
jgi:translation initiation factor IF-3